MRLELREHILRSEVDAGFYDYMRCRADLWAVYFHPVNGLWAEQICIGTRDKVIAEAQRHFDGLPDNPPMLGWPAEWSP